MPPIPKPPGCAGCPFQHLSEYITPDYILPDSEILILAQNPGTHEEQGRLLTGHEWSSFGKKEEKTTLVRPQPLIGASGKWLKEEFWPLTKLDYSKVSRANVIKCRPYGQNDLPSIAGNKPIKGITNKMLKAAVSHCTRQYLRIPPKTNHVLAMGGLSLYHMTGQTSITEWRGWTIGTDGLGTFYGLNDYYDPSPSELNIFATIHIASLFEQPKLYHATLLDFQRFGRLVKGEWPKPLPAIRRTMPLSIPNYIGFDTEYDEHDNAILLMWSMADTQGNVYAIDRWDGSRLTVQPSTTVVTQNGLVDIPHFRRLFDVSRIRLEDCMFAHSTLHTGELSNLDYMTSKYGQYNRHKHLRITHDHEVKALYAGLDADTTLNHVWKSLLAQFKRDPLSWNEYNLRRQPLLSIIDRFNAKGVAIHKPRVQLIAEQLDREMAEITQRAKEITENPEFLLSSTDQVEAALYSGKYRIEKPEKPAKAPRAKRVKVSTDLDSKLAERLAELQLELGV